MASPEVARKVSQDFEEIWRLGDHSRLEHPVNQKAVFRAAHRYAYCLSLLAKAATSEDEHRRVFLQELASDALHLLHILMMGDGRGGSFYLRSMIENFWRHSYFKDHVVEYGWLTSRKKYYMTLKDLRDYCSWLDAFTGGVKKALMSLEGSYVDLSKRVHSTSVRTLVLRESLEHIQLNSVQSKELAKSIHGVMKDVITLVIVGDRGLFDALHVNSQSFIDGCLDSTHRKMVV